MPKKIKQVPQVIYWKQAFDEVIDHYHKMRSSAGTNGSLDYERALGGGSAGNLANVITVSPSDFICDVEVAGRRALQHRPELFAMWEYHYVHVFEEPDTADLGIDTIRIQVGRAFVERRVYPNKGYFRPKTIHRKAA